MNSLRIEASNWLKSDDCSKGAIQDRTKAVLYFFKEYIKSNKAELETALNRPIKDIMGEVDQCSVSFGIILNSYLRGVQYQAVAHAKTFVKDLQTIPLSKNARLYKARKSDSYYLYCKEDMFHIPYDMRCKVGNFRFSISGMPCFYLGSSSYVCWEELGRVNFNSCNFCGYTNNVDVDVYDFSLPDVIISLSDVKRVCIALACSLSAKRDDLFKEEYIIPQCLFQALNLRHFYNHKLFGVKYLSVHALNGDADCFKIDLSDSKWVDRLYNYVFPAASPEKKGYYQVLLSSFTQTDTTSMFKELLLSPEKLIAGNNKDVYLDSQFGLMDAFLDKKMSFEPLRRESTFLTI